MSSVPIVLIELLLVGGVAIGFALWDLRSLERERRKREAQQSRDAEPAAKANAASRANAAASELADEDCARE